MLICSLNASHCFVVVCLVLKILLGICRIDTTLLNVKFETAIEQAAISWSLLVVAFDVCIPASIVNQFGDGDIQM
jgi:hypothetical protein